MRGIEVLNGNTPNCVQNHVPRVENQAGNQRLCGRGRKPGPPHNSGVSAFRSRFPQPVGFTEQKNKPATLAYSDIRDRSGYFFWRPKR